MDKLEITKQIVEKIMDWNLGVHNNHYFINIDRDTWKWIEEFNPLENITDTWKVIEKLNDEYEIVITSNGKFGYICNITNYDDENIFEYASERTVSLAICKAVLNIYGINIEDVK
jgi:hypothetical protein